MCAPGVVAGAMIAAGSLQAYSQVKQGQAQKRYYDAMADTARMQGDAVAAADQKKSEIAQDVGAQNVRSEAIKGAEAQGVQRVAEAANNIAGSGTAQDIAIDSMRKTRENEVNLKYNADIKSWELDTEGAYAKWQGQEQEKQYRTAGKQALSAAKRQAGVTLLTTAASVSMFGALGGFSGAGAKTGIGAANTVKGLGAFPVAPLI